MEIQRNLNVKEIGSITNILPYKFTVQNYMKFLFLWNIGDQENKLIN